MALCPGAPTYLNAALEQDEVISKVSEPTEWCSGLVVVPKSNKDIWLCVDLTPLNKAVRREVHPMASGDENLAKIQNSKYFSKLDANSGFWQIPHILEGLEGVVCHMDDVLVHAPTQNLHEARLRAVLQRLQDAGLTLNNKCKFSKTKMSFLGHIISGDRLRADPGKIKSILEFPTPGNVTELQRFNDMVNQLAKFLPNLAVINEPLWQLLRKDNQWVWDQPQEIAFSTLKEKLTSTEVLAHYDTNKPCFGCKSKW